MAAEGAGSCNLYIRNHATSVSCVFWGGVYSETLHLTVLHFRKHTK